MHARLPKGRLRLQQRQIWEHDRIAPLVWEGGKGRTGGANVGPGPRIAGSAYRSAALRQSRPTIRRTYRGAAALGRDPHGGHLVFRSSRRHLLKVVRHSGQGTRLFAERLERGWFLWPSPANGGVTSTVAQLDYCSKVTVGGCRSGVGAPPRRDEHLPSARGR